MRHVNFLVWVWVEPARREAWEWGYQVFQWHTSSHVLTLCRVLQQFFPRISSLKKKKGKNTKHCSSVDSWTLPMGIYTVCRGRIKGTTYSILYYEAIQQICSNFRKPQLVPVQYIRSSTVVRLTEWHIVKVHSHIRIVHAGLPKEVCARLYYTADGERHSTNNDGQFPTSKVRQCCVVVLF